MLTFYPTVYDFDGEIEFKKITNSENVSDMGAFSLSQAPDFTIRVTRKSGISRVILHLKSGLDENEYTLPFSFTATDYVYDEFSLNPDFKSKCAERGCGLFFYTLEFILDDAHSMFSSSVNNVDYALCDDMAKAKDFRLLIYSDDFTTPEWAKNVVMYHIFVDRFCKGEKSVKAREDSVLNPDWDNGIPEYPPYSGAPMKNNTFFGGNLYGVIEKLPYLKKLGVGLIYLSPIFKAYSNHKYDTGDYECIDEMFGGKEAFELLLTKAREVGIRVILDGVFNHTGDDSRYFNRYGKYDSLGAYQSQSSPYFPWYDFESFPDKYKCWWGIKILPKLMNERQELQEFFLGQNGVVRSRLREGTSGWRLDVADELPQSFLENLRKSAKTENPDALIIGEVWENAADKVAYSERRRYFLGHELDSVMNYPIKDAIIDFMKTGDADRFYNSVTDIYSSYPKCCCDVLMNILGTHDTERILTVLGGESGEGKSNNELAYIRMSDEKREFAIKLLKLASVLQFTLPGIPSIFYGDEAGMEGYHDPFCRMPYPWGRENKQLLSHYEALCGIKNSREALQGGKMVFSKHDGSVIAFKRSLGKSVLTVVVNKSFCDYEYESGKPCVDLLTGIRFDGKVKVKQDEAVVLEQV